MIVPMRLVGTLCVLLLGCAKIVGIDDYKLKDGSVEIDASGDASIDAPFGMFANYVKASNAAANDQFGTAVALSADGSTLVVGAPLEDSVATGVDGNQADETAASAGAVYVFVRTGSMWTQQAYLKASNTAANDQFGAAVAVSGDGNTIAVGAPLEDSAADGIDGSQTSNAAASAGAVYVFTRSGVTWSQQAYVKASNSDASDEFGTTVALSNDGATLAVGAPNEDSPTIGVNGSQANGTAANGEVDYGAVYVFARAGVQWVQQAYVKASNSGASDGFGSALALSSDGDTLVVSAPLEDSSATDVNGNQSSNAASASGAAYVFRRVSGIWAQQAYLKATNTGADDRFGQSVAISGDGNTIAVGAHLEDGSSTGIDGVNDNLASGAGAAYVYAQVAAVWTVQAYVKPSNTAANDQFGFAIGLSADGNTLVVGADREESAADGIGGNDADNTAADAGAAYSFVRATTWAPALYIKATNSEANDRFGQTLAVAGGLFVISAPLEDSAATGIGGDQANNVATSAGAVYVVQ